MKKKRKTRVIEPNSMTVKVLLGVLALLVTIIITSVVIFLVSTMPQRTARNQATQIARTHADLTSVEHFYTFSRSTTYYTVIGRDSNNKEIIVIVPAKGDTLVVKDAADGMTEANARYAMRQVYPNITITRVNLGLFDGKPTWEVVGKDSKGDFQFLLFDWESGKQVENTTQAPE